MGISLHVDFDGQCQEAFEYYAKHLDGTIGTLLPFRDSPLSSTVAEAWRDKIVHANIRIAGIELAGADLLPEQYQKPVGFYLLLGLETEEKTQLAFGKLAAGGRVILPLQKTFWSPCYGIVVDPFGVPWKVNCGG